ALPSPPPRRAAPRQAQWTSPLAPGWPRKASATSARRLLDTLLDAVKDVGHRVLVSGHQRRLASLAVAPIQIEAECNGCRPDDHLPGNCHAMESLPVDAAALQISWGVGGNGCHRIGHRENAFELDQRLLPLKKLPRQRAFVIADELRCRTDHRLFVIDRLPRSIVPLAGSHLLDADPAHVHAWRITR